jgi:hypothetical protein
MRVTLWVAQEAASSNTNERTVKSRYMVLGSIILRIQSSRFKCSRFKVPDSKVKIQNYDLERLCHFKNPAGLSDFASIWSFSVFYRFKGSSGIERPYTASGSWNLDPLKSEFCR